MNVAPILPLPAIMTTKDVAGVLQCSVATVERYIHGQQLVAVQIGRERRVRADDFLDFLATRPATARKTRRVVNQDRRRVS